MKRLIIIILSFFLVPSLTMATEYCINSDGSNGCDNPSYFTAFKNFAQKLKDNDKIILQSNIESFDFTVPKIVNNITIDLNGYTIETMNLGKHHQGTTTGGWALSDGDVTWNVVDGSPKPKTGRIKNLNVGENVNVDTYGTTTANITGILFEPGNTINVKKDGAINLILSKYDDPDNQTNESSIKGTFINNSGLANINSGAYYNSYIYNNGSLILGLENPGDNDKLNMYYNRFYNSSEMTINSGTYTDNTKDGSDYLIYTTDKLVVKNGTFGINSDYFIRSSGTATIKTATVNSDASLFYVGAGTLTINNGTYKTTTDKTAFDFLGGETIIYGGTIEAKNATVGNVKNQLTFGIDDADPDNTNPLIDMPKGIISMNSNGLINFNTGTINLAKRIDRFTDGSVIPRTGYYLNYTPVSDSYYKLHLSTTDTESTDPVYITGDNPIYLVSFDLAGGSGSASPQKIEKNSTATKPDNDPTKDGYVFKGWYLADDLYYFDTPVTDNIILTAKWVKAYTVTLNPNGGNLDEMYRNIKVAEGERIESMWDPWKENYSFGWWYTDSNFQKAFDIYDPVTDNIILYAKWYLKYDWNKDNEFGINDIYYYRYYLSGDEQVVKDYDDLDYYEKQSLNADYDTDISIRDLVKIRIALAESQNKN